jgi:glucose-6-phosphate isomerase
MPFFQLIHQGTKLIPCDFIGFNKPLYSENIQHNKLMSNFFAQTEALMMGKTSSEVKSELGKLSLDENQIKFLLPYKIFEGNKPTNTILIEKLSPKSLGSLILCMNIRFLFRELFGIFLAMINGVLSWGSN